MSKEGGNGSGSMSYFQDDKKEEYQGVNFRNPSRIPLSPELQTLLNILRQEKLNAHNGGCVVAKEIKPHLNHVKEVFVDIGEGEVSKGITKAYDQHKKVDSRFKTEDSMKKKALNTLVMLVVTGVCSLLIYAIVQKIRGV